MRRRNPGAKTMKIVMLDTCETSMDLPESEWKAAKSRSRVLHLKKGAEYDLPDDVAGRLIGLGLAKAV